MKYSPFGFVVAVQSLSHVRLFVTPWPAAFQAPLFFTVSWSLLRFMSIESVMLSNHLISAVLFSFCLQSFLASGFFSSESVLLCIRWPRYWSFSFNISPSHEHSVLISFQIDWFDLLAVQGVLKGLLQHRSSKASVLQCSAFFMVFW